MLGVTCARSDHQGRLLHLLVEVGARAAQPGPRAAPLAPCVDDDRRAPAADSEDGGIGRACPSSAVPGSVLEAEADSLVIAAGHWDGFASWRYGPGTPDDDDAGVPRRPQARRRRPNGMTAPARRAAYEALRAIESGRALLAEAIVASREPLQDVIATARSSRRSSPARCGGAIASNFVLSRHVMRELARLDPEVLGDPPPQRLSVAVPRARARIRRGARRGQPDARGRQDEAPPASSTPCSARSRGHATDWIFRRRLPQAQRGHARHGSMRSA